MATCPRPRDQRSHRPRARGCDQGPLSQVAYAPYELLVVGKQVSAIQGKFRIAQGFHDLTMGTLMKISSAPGAISAVLTDVADGP